MEHLIAGQHVSKELAERARELRRQMTPAERILWRHLRSHRMHGYHFRRQQVIGGYIADFYCDAARLVVEVDGPIHDAQADDDAERDRVLGAHGVKVTRFRNDEVVSELPAVLARVVAFLRSDLSSCGSDSAG